MPVNYYESPNGEIVMSENGDGTLEIALWYDSTTHSAVILTEEDEKVLLEILQKRNKELK